MFESKITNRYPHLWKIVLISALVFVGVVALLIFLLQQGAQQKAPLTGILHQGDPDYEWYRKYVLLKNPQVKMTSSFSGNRLVLFSAVIENRGERTIDVVEVELGFFNHDELVSKTTRIPIRPGQSHHTPPIETFEERGFTLYLENLPETWLARHAEMVIHGFRFQPRP